MREIKFRAYIRKLKWLAPVKLIDLANKSVEVDLSGFGDTAEYDFEEIVLMQYTGAKDCKGKKIYEGDIVVGENYLFPMYDNRKLMITYTADFGFNLNAFNRNEIAVIGNIYENKDLMKGEK